jgi:hypothetical protein
MRAWQRVTTTTMGPLAADRAGISRRQLLAKGGGVAAAVVGGTLLTGWQAAASVPPSPRFDLTQPSHDLFRHQPLFQQTVMQSFTFDNVNRRLFAAQLRNGASSDANGDVCVTQLDFAGTQLGQMFLNGFGHGVSIGVEPVGSTSFLWTEVDSVRASYSDGNPPPGNAHVSSVDLNGGGSFARVPTNAGGSLDYREPEGMAVYRTAAGETRLFLGFASGSTGARKANIFYKNVLG